VLKSRSKKAHIHLQSRSVTRKLQICFWMQVILQNGKSKYLKEEK